MNSWIHIAVWAVVIGALFAYCWWKGLVTQFADYVRETREELLKCAWPSWIELRGSTVLISMVIVILSAFVFITDLALRQAFFNFLYNL